MSENMPKEETIMDVLSILGEAQPFRLNSEVREVFVFDLIRFAAQDREQEFDEILNMSLEFEQPFFFHITYEYDSDGLKDTTDAFPTLLHLACYHFSDKYAKKVALRMIGEPDCKKIIKDEITFSYAIFYAALHGLNTTLNTLLNNEWISQEDILKTYFVYHYERLALTVKPLLAQDNWLNRILPVMQKSTTLPIIRDWHLDNIVKCLADSVKNEHIQTREQTQYVLDTLVAIQTKPGYATKLRDVKSKIPAIIIELAGRNLCSPDEIVFVSQASQGGNNPTQLVEKTFIQLFGLTQEHLEQIITIRHQRLSEKLDTSTIKTKLHKI